MQTITFIGNGNMGLSIAKGLKDTYNIEVVGRNMKKLDAFEKALDLKIDKYLIDTSYLNRKVHQHFRFKNPILQHSIDFRSRIRGRLP